MAVYGIADLHLDSTGDKPMDIFGNNWVSHQDKIFNNWRNIVSEDDIVLIAGDISWALRLSEAYADLMKIEKLPGNKVITRGNHDYWWSTKSKLEGLGFKTIHFLHNDSFLYNSIVICGARGWASKDSDEFDSQDEKIFSREINRLDLSLSSIKDDSFEKIVMLHYPPFNTENKSPNEFVDIMKKYNVTKCVYGHLHGEGHKLVVEGNIEGIDFHCIACDYINFTPKEIIR
ncbi:metallophosphoesterase [Proteiniborus sp. DW1]|uniref:metallophosphoesterase n=1 Tax=Proteiniborus sp. DW1 TaxID=1889883 RepID=UPI0009443590|nr:metallophosphoesterase [Proteiniborus sp. DW1]